MITDLCPCGSQLTFDQCCAIFITNKAIPQTPEQLMRSRYTAYTQANVEYIRDTMAEKALVGFDLNEAKKWALEITWLKLEVLNTKIESEKGWVEFKAYYLYGGKHLVLHELSEFKLENNKWFYVDGFSPSPFNRDTTSKISRNDPCPCGSKKKFKKCCAS